MPLVLVGPTSPWALELPRVTLTGQVSDDELAAIYTGAHALVFPSDEEGFGLPPVEALACGTPVVASDVPALREVLDGRAVLADVGDLDGLLAAAEAIRRPAPGASSVDVERRGRDHLGHVRAGRQRRSLTRPQAERRPVVAPSPLNPGAPSPGRGEQPPGVAIAGQQVALAQQHVAER